MNKRIITTLYFIGSVLLATAQQGWKFHPSLMTGASTGQLGASGQLKANLAFTHGPWSFGPGVAIDFYRYRTVPVFLSVTRDLSSPQSPVVLFLFGEGGIDYPWYYPDTHPYDYYSSDYRPASWFSAGPGLRFRLSRHHPQAILLNVGYTHKNVKEVQSAHMPCTSPNTCAISPSSYSNVYTNNLLVFSIGLRF